MSYLTFAKLDLGELAPTCVKIKLADKIVKHPTSTYSGKCFGKI